MLHSACADGKTWTCGGMAVHGPCPVDSVDPIPFLEVVWLDVNGNLRFSHIVWKFGGRGKMPGPFLPLRNI
jgi:hypothetical protein